MQKIIFHTLSIIFVLNFIQPSMAQTGSSANPQDNFAKNGVIAHRGAWKKDNLPQNSVASLQNAIRLGVAGSEFDVQLTADEILVVNHDPDYEGMPVEKSDYSNLSKHLLKNGELLPTLESYLKTGISQQKTRLILELKPSRISRERSLLLAQKAVEKVNQLNAREWIIYISFDYDILKKILQLDHSAKTMYLGGNVSPTQLKADGIYGADYQFRVYEKDDQWIKKAHEAGIETNIWTVNDSLLMDYFLARNIDYITTDEPELMLSKVPDNIHASKWKLIWSDEFSYNGLPDSTKWTYEVGGHGWGNNEKQYYLEKSIENSVVKNGVLSIIALKKQYQNLNYTSAKLTTYNKLLIQYGKIDVMAKLPRGKGNWPAIWMLSESFQKKTELWPLCGEIDIMEHVGNNPNSIHTSLHSELYNHMKGTQVTHFEMLPDVFDSFHKYGIEWTKEYIRFFIDDKLFFESYKGQDGRVSANEGWPFDKPFYLILNLAIGGGWGGEIDDTIFPNEMQIDYVRVYKFNNNVGSKE